MKNKTIVWHKIDIKNKIDKRIRDARKEKSFIRTSSLYMKKVDKITGGKFTFLINFDYKSKTYVCNIVTEGKITCLIKLQKQTLRL